MPIQLAKDGDPLAPHSLSASELKELLAAERVGEAILAFRDEHGHLCFFAAGGRGESSTLGRRTEMDVSIPWDNEVSGLHAELHHLGGEWTVVDDGLSTNGTYVNGQRISGRQRLRDGDRIRVGRTVLAFKAPQASPLQQTVAAGDRPALLLGSFLAQRLRGRAVHGKNTAKPVTTRRIARSHGH